MKVSGIPRTVSTRRKTETPKGVGKLILSQGPKEERAGYLMGVLSQGHKRFKGNNMQGAANCVVAIACATLTPVASWFEDFLTKILDLGSALHLKSLQFVKNKCIPYLEPPQVHRYFFIGNIRFTMSIGTERLSDMLRLDKDPLKILRNKLLEFFRAYDSGIVSVQKKHFAIWRNPELFFLFDPRDHDVNGRQWRGIPGMGFCYLMVCVSLDRIAATILENITVHYDTNFMIYSCSVENLTRVSTKPPESVDAKLAPPPEAPVGKKPAEAKKEKPKPVEKVPSKQSQLSVALEDKVSKSKIPLQRPRLESVTHFIEIEGGASGILRASTHQCDPKFSKYLGKQSAANAVAALAMLRFCKARHWVRHILDNVLRLGEVIYHESKNMVWPQLTDKITIEDKEYAPKIKQCVVKGRLNSNSDRLLDLGPALFQALSSFDCCIVKGPLQVAVWIERGRYYMFDPNERDAKGRAVKAGEPPGVACVMWFSNVADLVAVYITNTPRANLRDYFHLDRCVIEDYVTLPEAWYNFRGIARNKWILRGTFNQNNRRFPEESRNVQCTANAAMALVHMEMQEEKDWDSGTVDQVLIRGDEFYRGCVDELKEKNKFVHKMLMVDELKRKFSIEDKEINLEIDDCLVNGLLAVKSDAEIPNLRRGFQEFFSQNDGGVVTSHGLSVAVWKRDDTFFYYDSHSHDEKGLSCLFGTACLLRVLNIDDLASTVVTNLGPDKSHAYNISRILVRVLETTEDGVVKPPLNHYEALSDLVGILRSDFSEKHEKFGLNRGKQVVPMCLVALGFNSMSPALLWCRDDLNQILDLGDELYVESMKANLGLELPEEEDVDDISTNNVKKDFKIGLNRIEAEIEPASEGTIEENLKEALETLYQQESEEDESPFQAVLESDFMTVALWRDENLIYLFDPRPRDERGQVIGKDDWSVKAVEEEEEEGGEGDKEGGKESEPQEMGGGDNFGESRPQFADEDDESEYTRVDDEETEEEVKRNDEDEEKEGYEEEAPPLEKHSSHYWRVQEEAGKACVMRFCVLDDLINHLVENSPPNRRADINFTLKTVKVSNKPEVKEVFDPECEEKKDEFVGDWYGFREIDYGKWILRGSRHLGDAIYPAYSRGKQEVPMCFSALAFIRLYSLTKFTENTVDSILMYGDRLYTVAVRRRLEELKKLSLTEEEMSMILGQTEFSLEDFARKLCVAEHMVTIDMQSERFVGDINSKDMEEVPDVGRGLTALFEEKHCGLLSAKGRTVAVWKLGDIFYMFDPHPRGPDGVASPTGVSCITRFKNLDDLVDVFLQNLPKEEGDNFFAVHAVSAYKAECSRERQPEERPVPAVKLGGFVPVVPGKDILRGEAKQDYTKFDRGVHVQSPAVAFAALTVALVEKPETWTHATVDEILNVADQLHTDTIKRMGIRFNPWNDKLDIFSLNNDFMVGKLKANCEIRFLDQHGLVDAKNSKTPNLRQGIERFFEENSHGILSVDRLVLALWEEERKDEVTIYMYDPNPRGATGLPMPGGTACVMKFCNAKMASDHVMAAIPGDKAEMEFVITPVEILVGTHRTKRKPRRESVSFSCRAKMVATDQKRKLRQIAEEERSKKEEKRKSLLGRKEFHKLADEEWILRGVRSAAEGRDVPTNVVAYVVFKMSPVERWSYKHLELIVAGGEQLYVDSFVAYRLDNKKMDLKYVLRKFVLKNYEVEVVIFKPIVCELFVVDNVAVFLGNFFQQETFCILNYLDKWVSIFFKTGYYYYFDPCATNLEGDRVDKGVCMVMKLGSIDRLAERVVGNLYDPAEGLTQFSLVMVKMKRHAEIK